MRRGVLTVDLDCKKCGGTGRVSERVLVPGNVIGPYAVELPMLCSCVLPAPVYSESDGGVSIGLPIEREGET